MKKKKKKNEGKYDDNNNNNEKIESECVFGQGEKGVFITRPQGIAKNTREQGSRSFLWVSKCAKRWPRCPTYYSTNFIIIHHLPTLLLITY